MHFRSDWAIAEGGLVFCESDLIWELDGCRCHFSPPRRSLACARRWDEVTDTNSDKFDPKIQFCAVTLDGPIENPAGADATEGTDDFPMWWTKFTFPDNDDGFEVIKTPDPRW